MQKLKKTGDSRCIYQNQLDIASFQHNMADEDFKDLPRKTASDKVFRYKAFNVAKNPKHDGYQRGLASRAYTFFDKKSSGLQNQELAEELHKPITGKFEKRKAL